MSGSVDLSVVCCELWSVLFEEFFGYLCVCRCKSIVLSLIAVCAYKSLLPSPFEHGAIIFVIKHIYFL